MSLENESFEGADSADAETHPDRTAFATLVKLADQPFKQVLKFQQYIDSAAKRRAKMVNLLSPKAVALIKETQPELLG
jgi:hypothetical protein